MKNLLLLFCLYFSTLSFSQINFDKYELLNNLTGTVESDRPGQALNATTCGVLTFQIQTGINHSDFGFIFGDGNNSKQSLPTNLRFGITDVWEINTSFNFSNRNFANGSLVIPSTRGFNSPEIGIRSAFLKGNKWKPYLAIQASLSVPSKRGTFQQPQFGSSFFIVTSNRFKHVSINTTLGLTFAGYGSKSPSYPYVLNIGSMLTEKLGAFVEIFGTFKSLHTNLDAGFSYLVTRDLQIDLFGGWLGASNWFAEIGVSWRLSLFQKMLEKNMTHIE